MEKEILQLGNSLAVIIPRNIAQQVGLSKGDRVDIKGSDKTVQIRRIPQATPLNLCGIVPSRGVTEKDIRQSRKRIHQDLLNKWKNF